MTRCFAVRLLLALLVLFKTSPASAVVVRTVTLIGVSGAGGPQFAKTLEEWLSRLYVFKPGADYRRQAQALGKQSAAPDDVRAVCAQLHLDAMIAGAIKGEGATRLLVMTVISGRTGNRVARLQYDLATHSLGVVRAKVIDDLENALLDLAEEPTTLSQRDSTHNDSSPADHVHRATSEQPARAADTTRDSEVTDAFTAKVHAEKPTFRAAGLQASVGLSLMSRYLHFNAPTAPSYSGGTIGGVVFHITVYPLGLSDELSREHPVLSAIGLVGVYEHEFGFTSTDSTGSAIGIASRWSVSLIGRIPLGHKSTSGAISPEFGFAQMNFSHSSQDAIGVPNVAYSLLDFGLRWDQPIFRRRLFLKARAAYLALLDAGDISASTEYGNASGWGFDAEASLSASPLKWLTLSLGARYNVIGLSFADSGTRFAQTARDQWVSGVLEVGFAL